MARRQVSIFVNGKEVANQINTIRKEKRKLNAELNRMTIGTEEYEKKVKELGRVNSILDDHRNKVRGIGGTWSKLAKGGITKIAGLAAGAFAVDTIVQYGKELFNVSTQMELLQRKAKTVFGSTLPQVTKAAEDNAAAMGLTTSQYINASAAIADLLIPMQFTRQEAADMSTDLVDLAGALSEWTGGQVTAEEVTKTLGKAILGEREELKQLGISIQEADVKARLADKGLDKLTGTMLQQAKAAATLELITEKSIDAQTAFAENSDLSARRQAELVARITDVTNKLATALIPVFERLVDVAEFAVGVIDGVADALVRMGNPAKAAVNAFDDQAAAVRSLEKDLNPLLTRYDELTGKTDLTAEEQDELKAVIQKIGEVTPGAITEIDKYGNALSINAGKSREFLAAEKARLEFINKEAITALEDQIENLNTQAKIQKELAETGETGGIISVELEPEEIRKAANAYADLNREIAGAQAQLARLSGTDLGEGSETGAPTLSPTPEELAAQKQRAAQLQSQRQSQAKKALEDRQRNLQQLADALAKFEEDQRLASLTNDERSLEQVRLRYQKEIDLALALEQQGVTQATEQRIRLEQLRDRELLLLRNEQVQAAFDAEMQLRVEQNEERKRREEEFAAERAEANAVINEFTRAALLNERELALIELGNHYDELITLATQNGIDTLDIEIAFRREEERIRREFDERAIKETAKKQQKIAQNYAQTYSAVAKAIGAAVQLAGKEGEKATALQRVLTLAQIGFSSASAIAAATAAGAAAGPFPANLAAIATGVATVLGNIAQARSVLKDVPQFFEGGYTDVRGQQDGRRYRARYIGQQPTGYTPGSPVLMNTSMGPVLASERGREYFVSNAALNNPVVMDHVRAIDNIVKYRQFVDGGFTGSAPAASSSGGSSQSDQAMTATIMTLNGSIDRLNELLSGKIYAVIDNQTAIDLRDQLEQIAQASGGAA